MHMELRNYDALCNYYYKNVYLVCQHVLKGIQEYNSKKMTDFAALNRYVIISYIIVGKNSKVCENYF